MKRYFAILLSCALGLGFAGDVGAQIVELPLQAPAIPAQPPGDVLESKIFDVKNANLTELREALSIFGAQMNISNSLHVISVRARKEIMPAIEDAIKRLDVAPPAPPTQRAVELTIYILRPIDQQTAGSIPSALQPALNQLKNVFGYKGFEVLETQFVRGSDGREVKTSGNLPGLSPAAFSPAVQKYNVPYSFYAVFRLRTGERNVPSLVLEKMNFSVQLPTVTQPGNVQYVSSGLQSDVDVPFGQQVVVGKTTVGESPLILVMSAKFPD